MLTLITATPGSGKTLKALCLIFDFLKDGRNVWTNIDGIKITGVRTFEDSLENPFDWRTLDDGSVVVYDEAQKHPAFSKKDMSRKYDKDKWEHISNIAWNLDYHRHNGYDIVLITQSPKLLNQHTLDFVGEHLHLRRIFGVKQATIFHFPEYKLNPNTKSVRDEAINKETFKFPTHLFKFYQSATEHTHKTKIPLKYIIIGIFVFMVLPGWFYLKWKDDKILNKNNSSITTSEKSSQEVKKTEPKQLDFNNNTSNKISDFDQEDRRVAMVIESSHDCQARNSYGELIEMTINECRYLSAKTTRISFSRVKRDSLPMQENKTDYSQEQISPNSASVSYKPATYPGV